MAKMGDGSYIFAYPIACHQIAETFGIGLVVVILNNAEWGAVRMSVAALSSDGYAAKSNQMPLTTLLPSASFAAVARANLAFAETGTDPSKRASAVDCATEVAQQENCLSLLDVQVMQG